jgi:hypothetical protein
MDSAEVDMKLVLFCSGAGVLHGSDHFDFSQHLLRRLLLLLHFGQAGEEIAGMVRPAFPGRQAAGHDGADLPGSEIFRLALDVETFYQQAERSIAVSPELFPAKSQIKPGDGPEFWPA